MHGHGGHHGGGHHHGGHIPTSAFSNWGGWGWGWNDPYVYVIQDEGVPDWVWIAGGALAGILLAVATRR